MQRRRPSGTAASPPLDDPQDASQALEDAWNQWRADREASPDDIQLPDAFRAAGRAPSVVDEPPGSPGPVREPELALAPEPDDGDEPEPQRVPQVALAQEPEHVAAPEPQPAPTPAPAPVPMTVAAEVDLAAVGTAVTEATADVGARLLHQIELRLESQRASYEHEIAVLTASVAALNTELTTNREAIADLRRRIEDLHQMLFG
jgi:hypothetical protein